MTPSCSAISPQAGAVVALLGEEVEGHIEDALAGVGRRGRGARPGVRRLERPMAGSSPTTASSSPMASVFCICGSGSSAALRRPGLRCHRDRHISLARPVSSVTYHDGR